MITLASSRTPVPDQTPRDTPVRAEGTAAWPSAGQPKSMSAAVLELAREGPEHTNYVDPEDEHIHTHML